MKNRESTPQWCLLPRGWRTCARTHLQSPGTQFYSFHVQTHFCSAAAARRGPAPLGPEFDEALEAHVGEDAGEEGGGEEHDAGRGVEEDPAHAERRVVVEALGHRGVVGRRGRHARSPRAREAELGAGPEVHAEEGGYDGRDAEERLHEVQQG